MTTHVNKVHHITTITKVAKNLGEEGDWLWEIANEMEIEDGVIWVYGIGEDRVDLLCFADPSQRHSVFPWFVVAIWSAAKKATKIGRTTIRCWYEARLISSISSAQAESPPSQQQSARNAIPPRGCCNFARQL
ncbi:hypothetical protein BSZ21_02635 [Bradyrhizobium canariense]|uniref:hypothetical protein n=1 Tax=Bradyrhizobium canariense TaxID=255045 RepID=UPI000A18C6D2|nr:hypothetical protein [Bradyrhizobium canariense]OSI78136.1 hypothetical protein BSZ21_02635 [Bradyrhizobium canariense]